MLRLTPSNHLPSTMLKDADLGQICLHSPTCPRSDTFGRATSSVDLILPLAQKKTPDPFLHRLM